MEASLAELESGKTAVVKRLAGGEEFRKRLASLNIRVGKVIRKVTSQPFNGPVIIEIDHTEASIGKRMAEKVIVEPLPQG